MDKPSRNASSTDHGSSGFSTLLHQRMTTLGLTTVSQVAAKLDRSIGSVSGVLKGRKIPSDDSLPRYADFLGIPLDEARALVLKEREVRTAKRRHHHTEAGRAFERAVLDHAFASALASFGEDEPRGRGKTRDSEANLEDAREAYEAEITTRALANLSPRVLTLLRRMTPKQQANVEQICEAILSGSKVGMVIGSDESAKRSEWHRDRRTRRSRRLSASSMDERPTEGMPPAPARDIRK